MQSSLKLTGFRQSSTLISGLVPYYCKGDVSMIVRI